MRKLLSLSILLIMFGFVGCAKKPATSSLEDADEWIGTKWSDSSGKK